MNNNSKSGVMEDTLELIIDSKSENESFARVAVEIGRASCRERV